jgi:spermidine/putrescine transport system substrate-binding protein
MTASHDARIPEALSRAGLSRRRFLRGVGYGGVALTGGSLLAACGTDPVKPRPEEQVAPDRSQQEKVVNFSNWPLYIDVAGKNEGKRPTLDAFTKQTGIEVNYTEDVNDNDEFFGKVRPQLQAGQPTGRDLFVVTDWMAARMIRLGFVQQLDKANLPNAGNLRAALESPPFDPDRSFTMPWQSGFAGLAYNAKVTGEVSSVEELLTRPDLKGKVTMLTEMRDTMGLTLLDMGKDPSDFTADDYAAAIDRVQKAVDSGQIRTFTGNEYAQDLAKGNIGACVAWSGDVIQLQFEDKNIKFVTPDAGVMLWSDNMMVPNKAAHKANAETLMNYYYDPAVAAELAAWVNYICPVDGAQEEMQEIDPELADNPLIFPDQATLDATHVFKDLSAEEERNYTQAFQRVIGA